MVWLTPASAQRKPAGTPSSSAAAINWTAREDRYIDLVEEQRLRGMIIEPLGGQTARIERVIRRGMPVVLFDIHANEGDFAP